MWGMMMCSRELRAGCRWKDILEEARSRLRLSTVKGKYDVSVSAPVGPFLWSIQCVPHAAPHCSTVNLSEP
jgi:hypothetical protein